MFGDTFPKVDDNIKGYKGGSMLENSSKRSSLANRGMKFEEQIQKQCDKYKKEGLAYIDKLPTSWKVIRKGRFISRAFPEAKSKLDFYGTLKNGESIYIEAKSSQSTSIPLANFKEHQFVYLDELSKYTDHVYVLVEMKKYEKVFLVKGKKILEFKNTETRKSIPYKWFTEEENATLLNGVDFLEKL